MKFTLPSCHSPTVCICEHMPDSHENGEFCLGCSCRKFRPNPDHKVTLSVTISSITNEKFRKHVGSMHGWTKGAISFEVEKALLLALGEKDLDILMNDKEWREQNK
jgi:hypothetical protein